MSAARKQIALIAHDNRKTDLLDWARYNRGTLAKHELHATGTTGAPVSSAKSPTPRLAKKGGPGRKRVHSGKVSTA